MIKVSVVIPTYGVPVYLEKAIKSVQAQTLKDWELYVVDDNNPDTEARQKTEQLMRQFSADTRIHYLQHPHNKNGAAARNTGIREATGEYIAFLDGDDEYMPTRFEKCCNVMDEADERIGGVYTGCEMRRGGQVFNVVTDIKPGNFLIGSLACTFLFCTGSNLFIRRSIVEELGGFDEKFLRHQDYEFVVRFFTKYDWAAIQEPLVIKNNENVNVPDVEKMKGIKKQYLEKFDSVIRNLPEDQQKYIYHSHYIQLAEYAMRTKDYTTAKHYYAEASKSYRLTTRETVRKYGFRVKNLIGR